MIPDVGKVGVFQIYSSAQAMSWAGMCLQRGLDSIANCAAKWFRLRCQLTRAVPDFRRRGRSTYRATLARSRWRQAADFLRRPNAQPTRFPKASR